MNGLDYLILGILLVSALLSLFRGFVSEVLSLVFWIAAFWLASRLAPPLASVFTGTVASPTAQLAFAYAVLLIGFGALGGVVIWLVRRFLHSTGLGPTDRTLGLVFGLLRGVVIVTALTLLGRLTALPTDPAWRESSLLPHFDRLATASTQLLPQSVRERLDLLRQLPAGQVPAGILPAALPAEREAGPDAEAAPATAAGKPAQPG